MIISKKRGIRNKVELSYVTPLSGAFTRPFAAQEFGKMLQQKNINIIPDFSIAEVNNQDAKIIDYAGKEVAFDMLISIPINMGDKMIERSKIGDEMNLVKVDKETLQSTMYPNIFAMGDATNIPTSKAGSVVHFQGEGLVKNILSQINNKPLEEKFDGHANCFIVSSLNTESSPISQFYYTFVL